MADCAEASGDAPTLPMRLTRRCHRIQRGAMTSQVIATAFVPGDTASTFLLAHPTMHRFAATLLLIAGVIHLLPLPGVLGASHLTRLYGVTVDDPNLVILLRHRAVLFGLLGALLVAAVFRPEWRLLAAGLALVSAVAFLVIALGVGGYNNALQRVVIADVVAVACLLGAIAVELLSRRA